MIQGTEEWHAARLGKVTASRIADLTAKTKSGWSAARTNYMAELIAERLTGVRTEGFTNAAMQWGTDQEPEARAAYEFHQVCTVDEVGFIHHPEIAMSGASPDGHVGNDGMVEIKCPNTATHIETLICGAIQAKYIAQMQWQMACTGRAWCDFASYDPRLPADMQLYVRRVERDSAFIAETEALVREFLVELEAKIAALQTAVRRAA